MGGGYVYIWHSGLGSFNTYVFHFDSFGASTISSTIGTPVHTYDPSYYFIDAYATVDPVSHDILLAYRQTDASYEREYKLLVNRISPYGDLMWGEGILVLDNDFTPFGGTRIDAFEYGYGFSVIYNNAISPSSDASTVEAKGFTMDGDLTWETTLCSNTYPRTRCENTSGFHNGQNIVAWINSTGAVTGGGSGGLYGQNIGSKGEMGEITPPTPPAPCLAPTNFSGEYYYSDEMFGAMVSWNAPETTPHHYNLYREGFKEVIEIDPEYTSYFEEIGIGDYVYRLTAVYEDCESNYALTESGDNYVFITVTGVLENTDEGIVTVTKVYTLSGQLIRNANLEELSRGVYIVQGLTKDGKLINKKMLVE